MKKNNMKTFLVVTLLLVECFVSYLGYKSLLNKKEELPDVKLVSKEDEQMFAIMLNEGDGNYQKSTSKTWPGSDYTYNATKSGCIDAQGALIPDSLSYDAGTQKATITTNLTSYCYMYFDKN